MRWLSVCLCSLLAVLTASTSHADTTADNLAKYKRLRQRFSAKYVAVGEGPGRSLPVHERDTSGSLVRWGDGGVRLGWYIGLLATEHYMLQSPEVFVGFPGAVPGGNVDLELYYALLALERLDRVADASFPAPCTTTEALNGFFIRDDVPADMHTAFSGATKVSSDFTNPTATLKEMSQDQAYHLFLGLSLTNALLKPGVVVNGKDLRAWAVDLAERIGRHMEAGGKWIISNPACDNRAVARGEDARAFSVGTAQIMKVITGGVYAPSGHVLLGSVWDSTKDPSSIIYQSSDNLHMVMAIATAGNGFGNETSQVLTNLSAKHGWWIYPLLHRAIHGAPEYCALEAEVTTKARHLLDELPSDGIPISPYPGAPLVHGFTGSNRFIRPSNEHYYGNTADREYNGNDYLLLHNAYAIASPTLWEGGGAKFYCDGSPVPQAKPPATPAPEPDQVADEAPTATERPESEPEMPRPGSSGCSSGSVPATRSGVAGLSASAIVLGWLAARRRRRS